MYINFVIEYFDFYLCSLFSVVRAMPRFVILLTCVLVTAWHFSGTCIVRVSLKGRVTFFLCCTIGYLYFKC